MITEENEITGERTIINCGEYSLTNFTKTIEEVMFTNKRLPVSERVIKMPYCSETSYKHLLKLFQEEVERQYSAIKEPTRKGVYYMMAEQPVTTQKDIDEFILSCKK